MPSSSTRKDGMPLKDPYKVLGISPAASETAVKKAYRQLALKVHPDKQSGTLTDSQREALDKQFHDIKDARSFLLDADHAEARRKYDADLSSQRVRHVEEERRERTMSGRRKRMREELSMRERMAKTTTATGANASGGATAGASSSSGGDLFDVDRLRREGERMREEYANREAEVDLARKQRMAVERATQKLEKEDRQVRLKWSRKKVVGGFHTKESLTSIMEDFGEVEAVELLGSKGNAALLTFANVPSCKQCVDAYRTSETMRATFVGRRKTDYTARGGNFREPRPISMSTRQDTENLEERNLRQAAERERLMRQMELDEAGGEDAVGGEMPSRKGAAPKADDRWGRQGEKRHFLFPPNFPATPENEGMAPFELLEKYEKIVFNNIC